MEMDELHGDGWTSVLLSACFFHAMSLRCQTAKSILSWEPSARPCTNQLYVGAEKQVAGLKSIHFTHVKGEPSVPAANFLFCILHLWQWGCSESGQKSTPWGPLVHSCQVPLRSQLWTSCWKGMFANLFGQTLKLWLFGASICLL